MLHDTVGGMGGEDNWSFVQNKPKSEYGRQKYISAAKTPVFSSNKILP